MFVKGNSLLKATIARFVDVRGEIFWVALGQLLALLGIVAGIKFLTNTMSEENYGYLALGMTIAGLVSYFIYGPLANAAMRYFSIFTERGEMGPYLKVLKNLHVKIAWILFVGGSGISCVAMYAINLFWAGLILIAILFGIASGINGSFSSLLNTIRRRKIMALHQGADAWLRAVFAVIAVFVLDNNAFFALLGFLAGTLCVAISQGLFVCRDKLLQNHWQDSQVDEGVSQKISLWGRWRSDK